MVESSTVEEPGPGLPARPYLKPALKKNKKGKAQSPGTYFNLCTKGRQRSSERERHT